jgi:hypothetical protein
MSGFNTPLTCRPRAFAFAACLAVGAVPCAASPLLLEDVGFAPAGRRTVTRNVPFRWTVTVTGDDTMSVAKRNKGPTGVAVADADTFLGTFVIGIIHNPKPGWISHGTIPTSTALNIRAAFYADLVNNTFGFSKDGVAFNSFVDVTPTIFLNTTPFSVAPRTVTGFGEYRGTTLHVAAPITVRNGTTVGFVGAMNLTSLFGQHTFPFAPYIDGVSHLKLEAVAGCGFPPSFVDARVRCESTTVPYTYVPEAGSVMLSLLGVSAVGFRMRRLRKPSRSRDSAPQ